MPEAVIETLMADNHENLISNISALCGRGSTAWATRV